MKPLDKLQRTRKRIEQSSQCPQCATEINLGEIKRQYGKESDVYKRKFCSAKCFTDFIMNDKKPSLYAKGEWKTDGTVFSNQTRIVCNDKTIGNWDGHLDSNKMNGDNAKRIIECVNMHNKLMEENKELKEWKDQQIKLTAPILEFMQNNADKFNLKVGDSIFKEVLHILKQVEQK